MGIFDKSNYIVNTGITEQVLFRPMSQTSTIVLSIDVKYRHYNVCVTELHILINLSYESHKATIIYKAR